MCTFAFDNVYNYDSLYIFVFPYAKQKPNSYNTFSICFSEVCLPRYFGIHCKAECHCKKSQICDQKTGVCPGPCARKYMGPNCQQSKFLQKYQYMFILFLNLKNFVNTKVSNIFFINCSIRINSSWSSKYFFILYFIFCYKEIVLVFISKNFSVLNLWESKDRYCHVSNLVTDFLMAHYVHLFYIFSSSKHCDRFATSLCHYN